MSQRGLDEHILSELLYLRTRLDSHVQDEVEYQRCVQKQLSALREEHAAETATLDTKMKGMVTGISMLASAIVASIMIWITSKFGS